MIVAQAHRANRISISHMNFPMNPLCPMIVRFAAAIFCALPLASTRAAEVTPPAIAASDLAARLSASRQDGAAFVRLRLEMKPAGGGAKTTLQLQVKERRTKSATELVYQVLWPKERKGEAVLLRKTTGRAPGGSYFTPPDRLRALDASQMKEPLFGSDLSYEDLTDDFFAWENQATVGTEVVNRVSCQILESKPGKGDHSSYAKVRSWVDTRRMVPLRVEKYSASGNLARRIESTRVATDDKHRHVPASLSIRGPREDSVTELDGSSIRHDVIFAERDFTAEGMKDLTPPRSVPE